MVLNPKKRFLEQDQLVRAHKELVVSNGFHIACEAALLQLQLELQFKEFDAAAKYHFLLGAEAMINYLLNVAESTQPAPRKGTYNNLDHSIK